MLEYPEATILAGHPEEHTEEEEALKGVKNIKFTGHLSEVKNPLQHPYQDHQRGQKGVRVQCHHKRLNGLIFLS